MPGDLIWVKEAFALSVFDPEAMEHDVKNPNDWDAPVYKADHQTGEWERDGEKIAPPWRSPRFMPKWAARIWLELTGVRVERLQDISSGDALSEGVAKTVFWQPEEVDERPKPTHEWAEPYWDNYHFFSHYPQRAFSKLWDSLNVKRGFPWSGNWWVWVLEFRLLEGKRSG